MAAIPLSRRWIRQLVKVAGAVIAMAAIILIVDTYYNILPTSIQTKLLLHQHGHIVTDVKVETCYLKSQCPSSTDNWYKIPKDLYLSKSWAKHGFLYVKYVKEDDLASDTKVILDAAVSDSGKIPSYILSVLSDNIDQLKAENGYSKLSDEEIIKLVAKKGWSEVGHGIWVRKGKYSAYESVTSMDVLFGPDAQDPRLGWGLRPGYINGITGIGPRLSVRIGPKHEYTKPELRVNKNGLFKIIQLADLHFSTGVGKCREPFPDTAVKNCEADPRTLSFLEKVLDHEKPDYAVLTGDQVFGQSSPDSETTILKVLAPLIKRKIPYSIVMGNHDDDGGSLSRRELVSFVSDLPYSLTELGPEDVSGYGNYVQQALGPRSDNPALTFYFLDSHNRSPNPKGYPGYAWIEQNQLDFVKKEHDRLKPGQEAFTHIHMSMAFFHIPLLEYASQKPYVGSAREGVTASRYNSGARDVLSSVGVRVISVGHDHVNDYCMFHDKNEPNSEPSKIWLCYGGGGGEGGYGGYGGYERRFRLFEVNTNSGMISTWKNLHEKPTERVDNQTLVINGQSELNSQKN